jgi:hypothetical protein
VFSAAVNQDGVRFVPSHPLMNPGIRMRRSTTCGTLIGAIARASQADADEDDQQVTPSIEYSHRKPCAINDEWRTKRDPSVQLHRQRPRC